MSHLNENSSGSPQNEESEEIVPGRKSIKKSNANKKKTHKMISSTYKKKKCEFYNKGACAKGSQCTFSHSFIPDVAKKICKFYLTNSCTKGDSCPYSHNTKRYPCKFYHIQSGCLQGNQCRFSHGEIDFDFQEQFLKDNADFLVKLYQQGKDLSEKHKNFIIENDLLNKNLSKSVKDEKGPSSLPFVFGFPSIKSVSIKQSNRQIISQSTKKIDPRRNSQTEPPFSIRFVSKNRQHIPQKLEIVNADDQGEPGQVVEENAGSSPNFTSNSQKQQLQASEVENNFKSHESKPKSYHQYLEEYMCSYF